MNDKARGVFAFSRIAQSVSGDRCAERKASSLLWCSVERGDLPMPPREGMVGHAGDMDADGTYGHEVDGELKRAAKIVDKAFSRVLKLPDASKRGQKRGQGK